MRILALLEAFPEESEGAESVLRGENRIILEKIIRKLFDRSSRCIPAHLGITSKACDENRGFHVELPELGYGKLHQVITECFPKETEFIKPIRFVDEVEALKKKYVGHELVGNFFKRARPIILPKHDARENYGVSMQDFFLPAVVAAYKKMFSSRKFINHRNGELDGKISIIPDTGHDELVAMMAEKSFAAWYSPNPFQGFSINSQREAMKILMQQGGFALAGGVDTAVAVIAYAGEMARDYNTPVYTCSALSWQSADYSLYFCALDDEFNFDDTGLLADAYDYGSGGLVLFR